MAQIIIDDLSSQFGYGGGNWTTVAASHFYGGSATWPDFAEGPNGDSGSYGLLTFNFQGTSIAFFGNTPPSNYSQWSFFSIDGNQAYNSSFMDPSPPSSRQWYQSPTLPDAQHNINVTHIPGTSVDYVVVTAGQNTPLLGETLIVDDTDFAITYSGGWTKNTGMFSTSYAPFIGLPFGNSTHQTSSVGASAEFSFTGTGVTVAGIFSYDALGQLVVNYTLDGFSSIQNYTVTTATAGYQQGIKQTENFVFFTNTSLQSGNHTLLMQVTTANQILFELDYITYSPSFATLASKPSLPVPSLPQSSSTSTSTSSTSASTHSIAAIVGGVVGGVIFVLTVLIFLGYRKRMLKKRSETEPMRIKSTSGPVIIDDPFDAIPPDQATVEPFVIPPSVHSGIAEAHTPNAKTQLRTAGTSGAFPSSPSSSQVSLNASGVFTHRSSISSAREDDRLIGRMQRLQTLISDLSRESAAAGGDASNNPRVAEVRGRIAELVREESDNDRGREVGSRKNSVIIEMETLPPPAYETI